MKKWILGLAVIALAVPLTASAGKNPKGPDVIVGTSAADVLRGGNSPDVIRGLGGDDRIWGNRAPDRLFGGRGADTLHGFGSGNAPDLLDGGPGHDTCIGTSNDTYRSCETKIVRRGLGPRGA